MFLEKEVLKCLLFTVWGGSRKYRDWPFKRGTK